MSDYKKYKESHLKAQKKYDDKNREKKHEYDKLRWQRTKENKNKIENIKNILKEYCEEENAIEWLKNKTNSYNEDSKSLHYYNILYNLIINLLQEMK